MSERISNNVRRLALTGLACLSLTACGQHSRFSVYTSDDAQREGASGGVQLEATCYDSASGWGRDACAGLAFCWSVVWLDAPLPEAPEGYTPEEVEAFVSEHRVGAQGDCVETRWESQEDANTRFAFTPTREHVAGAQDALFFVKKTTEGHITVMDTVYRLGMTRASEEARPTFELRSDRILRYGNQSLFVE